MAGNEGPVKLAECKVDIFVGGIRGVEDTLNIITPENGCGQAADVARVRIVVLKKLIQNGLVGYIDIIEETLLRDPQNENGEGDLEQKNKNHQGYQ